MTALLLAAVLAAGAATDTTSYCLRGTMADGSYTRPGSAAHNGLALGTRIWVTPAVNGRHRFVVRDRIGYGTTLDLWAPTCAAAIRFGRRVTRVRVGWGHDQLYAKPLRGRDMTQTQRVLKALEDAGPTGITQGDFLLPNIIDDGAPITRVGARIKELRDDGHLIESQGVRHKFSVYVLVRPKSAANLTPDWNWPERPAEQQQLELGPEVVVNGTPVGHGMTGMANALKAMLS
jgi:3D (Asp-Asp-Asp) domain-containing protein